MGRSKRTPSYPPGHQPYDRLVGMRIGALVGGVIGVVIAAITSGSGWWAIPVAATVGGVTGHRLARHSGR